MPRLPIDSLPDDARIWVFGISPALDAPATETLLGEVDRFLDEWAAHGAPIVSAREVRDGSFLVIGVDKRSETSGCSIDRMFGVLRGLERQLNVSILDPDRIFYRSQSGAIEAAPRTRFRDEASTETIVFDTIAERLGDIRAGRWERPAADSWHARLL